jgi:predicted permease
MLQHYFTVALRNFRRQKAFSFINVAGLALGLTGSMLILLWVQDERRVDNFHRDGDALFSVYKRTFTKEGVEGVHGTNYALARELKRTIPEVQYATSYGYPWGYPETFAAGDVAQKMSGNRADSDFFNVFSYPLLEGTPESALRGPDDVAISRKMADLFFGSPGKAIGRMIRFENKQDLLVTAVFENLPVHATHRFDYLMLNAEFDLSTLKGEDVVAFWTFSMNQTFLRLRPDADPAAVEKKIARFLDPYVTSRRDFRVELGLQRFGDVYLHSGFVNGKPGGGRIDYVRLFTAVAGFLVLIACINFMNLATARSARRAREVGMRKVVGSSRAAIARQFLGEAMLLALFALVLSLVLVAVLLPLFNEYTGKRMALPLGEPAAYAVVLGLALVTGLVAGSYPALYLSSLQPVQVLKTGLRSGTRALLLRKGLVVFQFSLSILLLIGTLVVSRQTDYVQTKHLGYNRENLLYFHQDGALSDKNTYLHFKEQAGQMPGIKLVDISSEPPHAMGFLAENFEWEGKTPGTKLGFKPTSVGYDFLKIMDLKLAAGRDFSRDRKTDSTAFMVNEEALRQMGLKDPLGKWISAWEKKGTIIGVLKDYHVASLHKPIEPVIVDVKEDLGWSVILVRTQPGQTKQALASLETLCKRLNPGYPFVYSFIDEEYGRLYKSEQLVSKLTNAFSAVAVAISCLGLLGLAMFSAERRRKEIGIRRVLGASARGIVVLFSREFLALVAVSFGVAAPLGYYLMGRWLTNFAYGIHLQWWMFAAAGAAALGVALLTVSVQAVKAALANPVRSLRSE